MMYLSRFQVSWINLRKSQLQKKKFFFSKYFLWMSQLQKKKLYHNCFLWLVVFFCHRWWFKNSWIHHYLVLKTAINGIFKKTVCPRIILLYNPHNARLSSTNLFAFTTQKQVHTYLIGRYIGFKIFFKRRF